MRFAATASALGSLVALPPASGALAAPAAAATTAATCKFAPRKQIDTDTGVEPQLLIDGTCVDPDYNESSFVIDKTEQLTFQVPDGGPLIPFTQVTGHFPATRTLDTLPPGVRQSPTTFQQNYVFRFPAKEYWHNRSFEVQHPTNGGVVNNRMAFTNGAFSVNWMSASVDNAVASHRHEAAATKVAKAYANKLYGNTAHIYSYFWGCSGGGVVSMAAAENVTGVWDGVQPECMGPTGTATYHSFQWQAHYTMAIPKAKQDAIAAAALPGGTGDIYAGLNDEEKSVLNELLAAGYPLPIIGQHWTNLIPLVDAIDIRLEDPTYEDDFWSKPGYAGVNPPNYLKAAYVDGWATIAGITRDATGAPTAIQFDPATVPKLGTIGDAYLEYWVYGPDGKSRLIDPVRTVGVPTNNKQRFSLMGILDPKAGTLALTGNIKASFGPPTPISNSKVLLGGLKVGSKVRINNRFILAMYYYPRYSNIPGGRSYDQYRNADGSPKYPQRKNIAVLAHAQYRTMGGRIETGAIKTKTMIFANSGDNLSWPLFDASYAQQALRTLGAAKAQDMLRFYLQDNGQHSNGGIVAGVFQQTIQDLMAWAEKGVPPPQSTAYTIRNGQVIALDNAADRHGIQPVMNLTVDGVTRASVGVNQTVNLAAKLEMPPGAGQFVQYFWAIRPAAASDTAPPVYIPGRDAVPPSNVGVEAPIVLEKPQPLVNVTRTASFDKPGTYVIRLTVSGQRDGQVAPSNQTLVQNWKEVRVVVQ